MLMDKRIIFRVPYLAHQVTYGAVTAVYESEPKKYDARRCNLEGNCGLGELPELVG